MYKNYGDENFFEYGVLMEKEKESEDVYNIIICQPDYLNENSYLFSACSIDINDTWIDKKSVLEYSGLEEFGKNLKEETALAVVEHYGAYNCGGSFSHKKKNEVIDYMNDRIGYDNIEDNENLK